MVLTKYDLDCLKNECSRLVDLVKYIEKSKDYDDLFLSREDYEESLKTRELLPEDFYNFRLFDVFSCVTFNSKLSKYMIKLKGFYSNILDKFKANQRSNISFIISGSLDETLEVWHDVIEDILNNKFKLNGLF